jgi:short-chain fatty acids transporter
VTSGSPGLFGRFERAVERYCPDPLVFAVFLTVIVLLLAALLTDTGPGEAIEAWGNGLHSLLAFIAQITLTIITAHVLAHTATVHALLQNLARLPRTPVQAYTFVTLCSAMFSLVCWPLGLIAGGLVAREVAGRAAERGIPVHYPLLGAAAFGGFVIWQMGYSSTIGLAVATAGNPLEERIGGVIPVTETLLSWWNLLTILTTLTIIMLTVILLQPRECRGAPPEVEPPVAGGAVEEGRPGLMGRLEDGRGVSVFLALLLFAYLARWFYSRGFDLSLNIVNWSFLALGLLMANSLRHYAELFANGARTGAAVLLQYPLYGGIMGLMLSSGLAEQFSGLVTRVASAETLPLFGFLSAGLINIFIPSGGAQWAIQGPIFIDAANALDVDLRVMTMSIAWGDQWTNLIQPFCAIPLLAVTGLRLREMYGYCAVLCLASSLTFALGLFLA